MNQKKRIFLISGIIAITLFAVGLIFFFVKGKEKKDLVIKNNVKIIDSKMDEIYQLISIDESSLSFANDPQYEVGDIIVAGIIDAAPEGFIRKVVDVKVRNETYVYETEYAVLTDVFEEAHIVRAFVLTQNGVYDMENADAISTAADAVMRSRENNEVYSARQMVYKKTSKQGNTAQAISVMKLSDSDRDLLFSMEFDELALTDNISIGGEIGFDTWIEVKLDVEEGEVKFGIASHTKTAGELFLGCRGEVFNKSEDEGEYSKDLYEVKLPNFQFYIGYVPVVITNDFRAIVDVSVQIEGSFGTTVSIESERVSGFEYTSENGKIQEINENTYMGDGLEWTTEVKASGMVEAGVYAHLITKLYGCTGADLSIGVMGNINGEVGAYVNDSGENALYGALELKVGPKAKGSVVVSVPIIDKKLADCPLFTVSLPMFIEKKWENKMPMIEEQDFILSALKEGDFSIFAGSYMATSEANNAYGGGQKLNDLILSNDGSLSGGGSYYSENFYPSSKPVSVTKNEDGSYLCNITDKSYFIIYPVGVIENREYVKENQAYLKDTVYINCVVIDGGVLDVTYYLNNSTNVTPTLLEYVGVDWVSIEEFTSKIGDSFISGTGLKYIVISQERNDESGRERAVLMSERGEKRMVTNLPAFKYDKETGIWYYDIFKYSSSEDYVEYGHTNL